MSERMCAMLACRQPAAAVPLVVDLATLSQPFEIPLCVLCREPFEAGMESVERLVEADAEVVPFRHHGRWEPEAER
jgi:hypothetical protein